MNRWSGVIVIVALAATTLACMFLDARRQQERIANDVCTLEGNVTSPRGSDRPLIVVLLAKPAGAASDPEWRLVDHFVSANEGRWEFFARAGTYSLSAFEDVNSDLRFQPDEPFIGVGSGREIQCAGGEHHE